LGWILPHVDLEIEYTEPAVRGDTSTETRDFAGRA
jgi:hypothetical protein